LNNTLNLVKSNELISSLGDLVDFSSCMVVRIVWFDLGGRMLLVVWFDYLGFIIVIPSSFPCYWPIPSVKVLLIA